MNRLTSGWLTLRYKARRTCGAPGAVGALVALVAALSLPTLERHWRRDAVELHRGTNRILFDLRQQAATSKPVAKAGEQIKAFNAWFPDVRRNADDLRVLMTEAGNARIDLDKGEYRMTRNAAAGFLNYDVVLPVKANYTEIRGFIASVLNAVPHASLAELRMERPAADNRLLDARVHFTFVYRGE